MAKEQLIDFFTSSDRGDSQLTIEQAHAEIQSLNNIQIEGLIQYYDAGLRGEYLRAIKLPYTRYAGSRIFDANAMNTIAYLMSDERGAKKLAPREAAAEINGLSENQLIILRKLYDSGLRGEVLCRSQCHNTEECKINALSFLINPERGANQLEFERAFAEIQSLNKIQIEGLIQYYDVGLRGEYLRVLKLPSTGYLGSRIFDANEMNTILFLMSDERGSKKLAPREAAAEINWLSEKQLIILRKLYDSGLRGEVLCRAIWHETDEFKINAILFLTNANRGAHQLEFERAFAEIKSLNKIQIEGLIQYYDVGLRGEYLRALKLPSTRYAGSRIFDANEMNTIAYLMSDECGAKKLAPREAAAEINGLSENQLIILRKLYDLGLRREVLCRAAWHDTDEFKINAILFLINPERGDHQLEFERAFAEVQSLNIIQIEGLIQYYDAGLRGEYLRALKLPYTRYGGSRSFDAYEMNTIVYLMSDERGSKKLAPREAAAEINGLSERQLIILRKLYDSGLRGEVLCRSKCHNTEEYKINAILFLINPERGAHQLEFERAFAEIKSLNKIQIEGLIQYYDAGLRREHLRAIKLPYPNSAGSRIFDANEMNTIAYLMSDERGVKKLLPQEAAAEINGLSENQLIILRKLYDSGLRGEVLCRAAWHDADEFKINAILFLINAERGDHQLEFERAFAEIKLLKPQFGVF